MDRHTRTGFTGTRHRLTAPQLEKLKEVIEGLRGWFHHGDCKGADEQAHHLAVERQLQIALHPPESNRLRAYCKAGLSGIVYAAQPYLERNARIVHATSSLIACPPPWKRNSGLGLGQRFAMPAKRESRSR